MSDTHTRGGDTEDVSDPDKFSKALSRAPIEKVFKFLTLLDLGRCLLVSKKWSRKVYLACKKINVLDCSQFWTIIGVRDTSSLVSFLKRFEHVKKLNLAYCQRMNDADLLKILRGLSHPEALVELNLFYCVKLTDKVVAQLIKLVPNIRNLNLGYDVLLTNQVVTLLARLDSLETLVLKTNRLYTDDVLSDFEHDYQALQRLDIQGTALDKDAVKALREARPELQILGPKSRNKAFSDNQELSSKKNNRASQPLDTVE